MGDKRRANCRECGKHKREVGEISWQGYCGKCGPEISSRTNDELHLHSGEKFENWRRGMILSAGGILPQHLDTIREGT